METKEESTKNRLNLLIAIIKLININETGQKERDIYIYATAAYLSLSVNIDTCNVLRQAAAGRICRHFITPISRCVIHSY